MWQERQRNSIKMASIRSRIGENMEDRYLYKAKRLDNGEWVQGVPFEIEGKTVILINDNENLLRVHYLEENMWEAEIYAIEVDPSTICQCTGLKDKNDNPIWENDIIKKDFYTDYEAHTNSKAYIGRVQYEDGGWSVEVKKSDGSVCVSPIMVIISFSKDIEHFEVIGNIFDNAELLESEE